MASAIDRQRNLNSEKGFVYIGEGGFNWAMSDGTRVILISNGIANLVCEISVLERG